MKLDLFLEIQVCYWFAQIGAGSIDPYICTHVIYSFIGLDIYGGLNFLDRSAVEAESLIIQMVHLKQQNPNLKVLAAVGGGDDTLVPIWTTMAANPTARENFATNIYNFVVAHSLDGIGLLTFSYLASDCFSNYCVSNVVRY